MLLESINDLGEDKGKKSDTDVLTILLGKIETPNHQCHLNNPIIKP